MTATMDFQQEQVNQGKILARMEEQLKAINEKLDGKEGLIARMGAFEELQKMAKWVGIGFVATLILIFGGAPTWIYNAIKKVLAGLP